MTFFTHSKNSACLLTALLLIACQPPASTDRTPNADNSETVNTPLIINADSVNMAADYILSIKPSRYQPSLGLQGTTKPIKQTRLIAARALTVEQVLITKGQWVEKGMPLLIVRKQAAINEQGNAPDEKDSTNSSAASLGKLTTTDNQAIKKNSTSQNSTNKATNLKAVNLAEDAHRAADSRVDSNEKPETSTPNNKTDDNNDRISTSQNPEKSSQWLTVLASFSGRVDTLYAEAGQQIDARKPLLQLSDETELQFIATLPIQAEPQLSVGQTVNFSTKGISEKFTGQVSNLVASDQPDQLLVYVNVVKNDASRNTLKPNMLVTGRVNYGQIEVGTIVPESALHDIDLTTLQTAPYQPLMPLTANVWIIKQDQRLTRQPVEVIEYNPSTRQYLIAGISNDSLICLADLPIESAGKKAVIS